MTSTSSWLGSAPWKFAQIVVVVAVDLGVPDELGLLRAADPIDHRPVVHHLRAERGIPHLVAGGDLVEADAVQVDVTEVLLRRGLVRVHNPVAVNLLGEGVEGSKEVIGDDDTPHVAVDVLPPGHLLGALDHDVVTGSGRVGDTSPVTEPGVPRTDPLAIVAAMDHHRVPGLGQ